ncbi:glycosyltransferase family 4 protein [Marisediminicola senii]|uniref:glycosyltransferase family 4 protein n=1 Tax=Marisediminicola senii TaxID=2711233 RepID=UPI0013EA86BE|nr:glycosyltransferase family 1 protein [Marisediminicola senii]
MTTTLRVIVDEVIAPSSTGVGRYAEELARELIATAPFDCEVSGVVSASPEADYDRLRELLPGMSHLFKSALARRELYLAWQRGFTRLPGSGMVHAPSLLAPLARHDSVNSIGDQTAVTVHDVVAWTHPDSMTPRQVAWHKSTVKRAARYADAVVVPTYTVAAQLGELVDFGDRIRVIGGAASERLTVGDDVDARADALGLPERYVLTTATLEPRKQLRALLQSLATEQDAGLPLVIIGAGDWRDQTVSAVAAEAGVAPERVIHLGTVSDDDLSVALDRAAVFAFPSLGEGFGLPVLEAFRFGTPVVHSQDPAVVEVAAGAGITVPSDDAAEYPDRLAAAISSVVGDAAWAARLGVAGRDRSRAFSWRDSAQRVWQLHADL